MLLLTVVAVFVVSTLVAVSTTFALLKFMFSALGQNDKKEFKPHA
jgi:hypothetical protein